MRQVEASLNCLAPSPRPPEFNMVDPARTRLPLEARAFAFFED